MITDRYEESFKIAIYKMGDCNHFLKKDSVLGKYYCYCEKYVNEIEISFSNINKEHVPPHGFN